MEEIWKKMNGYEAHYEVSNTGKVRCIKKVRTFVYQGDGGVMARFCQKLGELRMSRLGRFKIYSESSNKCYSYSVKRIITDNFGAGGWNEYLDSRSNQRTRRPAKVSDKDNNR